MYISIFIDMYIYVYIYIIYIYIYIYIYTLIKTEMTHSPVDARRRFNVYTTSCVYWESAQQGA